MRRTRVHFPTRNENATPWDWVDRSNPPPDLESLDRSWRDISIRFALRDANHASRLAAMLEEMFPLPWDAELRKDAMKLAAWLRSTVH
jgi:hypothetical protein